jgi:hypothetical protein
MLGTREAGRGWENWELAADLTCRFGSYAYGRTPGTIAPCATRVLEEGGGSGMYGL